MKNFARWLFMKYWKDEIIDAKKLGSNLGEGNIKIGVISTLTMLGLY
jgi:hypothetical protein